MSASFPKLNPNWKPNAEDESLAAPVPYHRLGAESPHDLRVVFAHRYFSPPSAASNDGGYQVNDSITIIRSLYPLLTGRDISEDLPSKDMEDFIPKIMLSVLTTLVLDHQKASSLDRHFFAKDGKKFPILKIVGLRLISNNIKKFKKKVPESFEEMMRSMVDIMDGNPFISCMDEPGPVDLHIYGLICLAIAVTEDKCRKGSLEKETWVHDDLKSAGALDWFNAVDTAYNKRSSEPVFPNECKEDASQSIYGFY